MADAQDLGWDDDALTVGSDPVRRRRYRRLQSWYRETQLAAPYGTLRSRPVGSHLAADAVERQPDLNFLWPAAAKHVDERGEIVAAEGGTMEMGRLRHNLLSSMPLCFNLFGALGTHPAFVEIIRRCFAPDADRVIEVVCEFAPQPPSAFLDDRTAFDAFIRYRRSDGSKGFVAVETKYTEPFSPQEYRTDRYDHITATSGWFIAPDSGERLARKATNQLWRNVMLAAALEQDGRAGTGAVAVVGTSDDTHAESAVAGVRSELSNPEEHLRLVTLEQVVAAARATGDPDIRAWADRFERRYVDLDGPDTNPSSGPEAPRLGQPLAAPERRGPTRDVPEEAVQALSWAVAASMLERCSNLALIQTHPGGGLYDCLSLVTTRSSEPNRRIDLNRAGSIHVTEPHQWTWRGAWAEAEDVGADWAARLIIHHAGLRTDGPSQQWAATRSLATLLADTAETQCTVASAFHDSSGPGGSSRRQDVAERFADAVRTFDESSVLIDGSDPWSRYLVIEHDNDLLAVVDSVDGTYWNELTSSWDGATVEALTRLCREDPNQ